MTGLKDRIESGKPILLAEVTPPGNSDSREMSARARLFRNKVHALGISDNRDGIFMSAMTAAHLAADEGVEPILHMVTRDRNRVALVSDCIGAGALGINNLLLTSGTHQALGPNHEAKGVFDVDSTQLIQVAGSLDEEGRAGPFCIGAVAAPYGDPMELQVIRLLKKITAGAVFLVTQPVFDVERFCKWWEAVRQKGIHEKAAVIAGIRILVCAEEAKTFAGKRPSPMVPGELLRRIAQKSSEEEQRAEGLAIAGETIDRLKEIEGLRGFEIAGGRDPEAAIELIETAGLGVD
jgi:methylenetetrahydrofolate reductase (NADPH)